MHHSERENEANEIEIVFTR